MMKKIAFIIIAVLATGLASVQAQGEAERTTSPTWGLKAESNLSGFMLSGMSGTKSKMDMGATFGGFLNMEISKHFALQGELLFHFKSSGLENGSYRYWGEEIPIYAMFRWKTDEGWAYIGLGPYGEFGLSATVTHEGEKIDLYEKDRTTDFSLMNDFNSGFGVIAGYEFACGIQLNATYRASITNVLEYDNSRRAMHPHTLSLGIAYRFGRR
jgi:opacity protein-like surface antigen